MAPEFLHVLEVRSSKRCFECRERRRQVTACLAWKRLQHERPDIGGQRQAADIFRCSKPECDAPLALRRPSNVRSEEHTSELQSLMRISYAVFCLKKKIQHTLINTTYYYVHYT